MKLIFTLILFFQSSWAQSGWTLDKHKLILRLSNQWTQSNQLYSGSNQPGYSPGDKIPYDFFNGGEYLQNALVIEFLYGLDDDFEVGVKFPYYDATFSNPIEEVSSQGFPELHLFATKHLVTFASYNILLQTAVKFSLSDYKKLVNKLNLGDQSTDISLGVLIASSFNLFDLNAYQKLSSHYTLRSSNSIIETDFGNQWVIDYETGVDLKFSYFILNPIYTKQFSDIKEGIVTENKYWFKLGAKLIKSIFETTQIEVNYYKTISGRNAISFNQLSIKLFHLF